MGRPAKKGATTVNPMLAELVVAESDEEDDTRSGSQFANPMLAGGGGGAGKGDGTSSAQMIAANSSEMTDEELSDLTYAFQAADMDGGGIIDADEFELMLTVIGATITKEQIRDVIGDAKEGFAAWKQQSDEETIEMCSGIWEEFDADNSGTMDRKEIAAVIERLKSLGANPDPISDAVVGNGELSFDEFMSWYLKQSIPEEFSAPSGGAPVGGLNKTKKKGVVRNGVHAVLLPLRAATKVASGPAQMLERSAKMIKQKAVRSTAKPTEGADDASAMSAIEEAMEDEGSLIFAEFAFMVSLAMFVFVS